MKAYKIEVGRVDNCTGRFTGREVVAYVGTVEKIEAKKEEYWEANKREYWLNYEKENNKIKFYVEEIEVEI